MFRRLGVGWGDVEMVGVTDIGGMVDLDAESDTLPVDVVVLLLLAVTD